MGSSQQHHYRGNLAERPLPEVLCTIDHYRVPGVIEARNAEGVFKRIYVKDRNIVFASSTDIEDSLGCYMLSAGMIDTDQFRATMRARRASGKRYGALLLEQDIVAPCDLYRGLRLHMAEMVWSLFSWREGDVTFTVGDFQEPSSISIQIPIRLAVKDGVRRIDDPRPLLAALGGETAVLEPSFDTDELIAVSLREDEYQLLKLVNGRRTVAEVVRTGPLGRDLNAKLLYAFFVLEFARLCNRDDSSGSIRIRLSKAEDEF
ncbi:MAG: DUF4388 domain-containing protein [Acidobacteriota bacterium]